MGEYIDREAALDKCGWYNTVNGKSICAARKDELAAIPAADVVEVVHGRWIAYKPDCRGYTAGFICSNCQDIVYADYSMKECVYNYCPNCGARMDGDTDGT